MSERVETAIGSLAVAVSGEAAAPAIVLANSLGSDMSLWDLQLPWLEARRRVVRFDYPGHGASGPPGGPLTMEAIASAVVAIMDRLGIGTADILGISLGGMTGIGLALDHPQRVRRVVSACARGGFPTAGLSAWDERAAAVSAGGMQVVVEPTLQRWFTPAAADAVRAQARRMLLGTRVEGYLAAIAALKALDHDSRLPDLQVPVLFVAASEDAGAPPATIREMARAAPGSRFAELAGLAHIPNMEAPAAFEAAITGFLFDPA